MHSQVTVVTPHLASEYLKKNVSNRRLRQAVVKKYAAQMKAGDFPLTHQGIAFDIDGNLLDGQHRLYAVVEAGVPIKMMVTKNVDPATFAYLDGGAPRNVGDKLGINPKIAEVVRFCADLANHLNGPQSLKDVYEVVGATTEELQAFCPSNAKHFATASMKFAAVTAILMGEDRAYVLNLYRNLCLGNVDDLPPVGKALVKLALRGHLSAAASGHGMLHHGLIAFRKRNAKREAVRLVGTEAATADVRAFYRNALGVE